MRRTVALTLFLSLFAAPALAQLGRDASPQARFVTGPDGRIARAWSLGVRTHGRPPEAARAFVDRYRGELALARGAELRLDRVVTAHGLTHARFVRVAHGGDVAGSSVVVRLRADGTVDYVGLSSADGLPAEPVSRRVDLEAAERIALAHTGHARVVQSARAALALGGSLVPIVRVDTAGERLHQRSRVLVDARDGSVLRAHTRLLDVLGRIYAHNPVVDAGATSDVELPFLTSRDYLTGRYFRVANCNSSGRGCELAQLAVADASGHFLYDPVEPSFTDPFAEVHTYFHLNRIAQYFRDTHAFEWTCNDDALMRAFVNYTESPGLAYDNAAYAPTTGTECGFMFFGQGVDHDFAYDADVIYHENTHAIVDAVAGLGPYLDTPRGVSFAPGAINEGIADYFAATISGDPALAEYFMDESETALRRLDNELVCPDDLGGEVHLDGRIWAGLGWDLHEALGAAKADALMFATLAALPEAPTLDEGAEILLASAEALVTTAVLEAADVETIRAAIALRGLDECEPIVPLDAGATRTGYSGQPGVTSSAGLLGPVQYRIDVPADATELRLRIRSSGERTGRYRLYGRIGEPVTYVPTDRPPLTASATYVPDESGAVILDRSQLTRCSTLYLAVAQQDLELVGPTLYELTAELDRSGLDEPCTDPDAGVAPVDAGVAMPEDAGPDAGPFVPGGGGCSCRAATRGDAPWALLLLLALLYRRR